MRRLLAWVGAALVAASALAQTVAPNTAVTTAAPLAVNAAAASLVAQNCPGDTAGVTSVQSITSHCAASAPPVVSRLLDAEGDSITYGAAAPSYATTYAPVANPALTAFFNPAVNGSMVAGAAPSLQARAASDDALLVPGGINILSVLIGANDLQHEDAAALEPQYVAYINDRVAAGWIVVGQTMIAADPAKFPGLETGRAIFNPWLKTQEGVLFDYLVDYTSTIMDLEATTANLTYYAGDGIHPVAGGYAVMEPVYAAVINAITSARVRNPAITLAAGSYTADQTTTTTTTTTGASIYYTLDGSTPTQSSTLYTGAVTISATETFKAKAFKSGLTASLVSSAAYTLTVATPTFSPAAGSYGTTQNVTISSTTPGTTIYYTTDGSTPTTGSTLYTGAISVAATTTIKALAVKAGVSNSAVGSATFSIVTFMTATGGTITTDGNYKVHTLTNGQTFTVTSGSGSADYLLAGSGGGGGTVMGGGGSGGEVVTGTDSLTVGAYPVVVGAAGVGSSARNTPGTDGGDTTWNGHTARKGRGGGSFTNGPGTGGVNGGGGSYASAAGGVGTNHSGGAGSGSGGGGGGAGQGADGQAGGFAGGHATAGNGGNGIQSSITGAPQYYGGGGGGGGSNGGGFAGTTPGTGGLGGGGAGDIGHTKSPSGTDGLGGGGGGGGYDGADGAGGDGGKGTVIVRYQFQ